MTRACPHCQASIDEGARFCGTCGKASAPTEAYDSAPPETLDPSLKMIGKEIAGRYRITAKLGEGGMGTVFRAEQMSLKRAVAVKILRSEVSGNPLLVQRFNAEAEAVAKLSHPNTVNIYDFGRDGDGTLFIAMEYVEGRALRSVLREGPLAPRRALYIANQVAASLIDAHSHKIVHRDLKPDNVMLQERGKQKDVVRVLDFGIAKLRDEGRQTQAAMTQAGDMLGTPQYMAPEQIRGGDIDGRVDVYALGCMIYEMITGRMPFEADAVMALLSKHLMEQPTPPSARRPDLRLAPQLDNLALAGMVKEAKGRPATMEAYQEMIVRTMASLPPDPVPHTSAPHTVATPMAYSAVPPQMSPAPMPPMHYQAPAPPVVAQPQYTPSPYAPAPPTTPQTQPAFGQQQAMPPHPYAPPQKSSAWKIWVIVGAVIFGLLVIAGIAGSQQKKNKSEHHDDDEVTADAAMIDPKEDPWAKEHGSAAPQFTPIPSGVVISAPGFVAQGDNTPVRQTYVNAATRSAIVIQPLDPTGATPLDKVAQFLKDSDFTLAEQVRVDSGGITRDGLWFAGHVNDIPMVVLVVLYEEPHYQIGIAFVTPAAPVDASVKQTIESGYNKFVRIP